MYMRRLVTLLIGAALLFCLAAVSGAQEKKKGKSDQSRVSGTVRMINKDTSTITVRTSSNIERLVVYGADTKFTKQNKPGGSVDELKEGTRVICLGKFNQKSQLEATRIDIRLPR